MAAESALHNVSVELGGPRAGAVLGKALSSADEAAGRAAEGSHLGLGIWCGGYFPLFEIFLGSANVWIEGARAGRAGIDITKHCIFTAPSPSDPPLGPFFGLTAMGAPNVLIGGFPLPSITSLAMAQAFKATFKIMGKAGGKLARVTGVKSAFDKLLEKRATAFVDRLLKPGSNLALHGDAQFKPPP